ncbi:YebC/PmpR family DNA-binding transcriptional regulator [bacterium]|jgi:YebC/PmpR family DNA-binding regulatory protein|nr:YebC/PmpR family DNA-binding transcriptional regulator [bacterium]MBT6832228.1 YebC/PmpR family DNA-binding transcriptional regulator [bacterium]MBT6996453.1 YebC/PmpR family DNA-binding transcriptional regulator [bacterium]MBT7772300.1 YebC/PmpR family DNA-binding transcriptional regulator [bacterium]
MSGHSKWNSIKHKKAATDAKRGKILTKHSKILSVVGRSDPNPETNASLRVAIVNAKSENVPNENIDRILKKLSGDGKDAAVYSEQVYEGFAPHGIPVVVTALTENINRTFPAVKTAFGKNGGTLGSSGSVMFQFDHVGVVVVKNGEKSEDELFELAIDAGGEDFLYDEKESEIVTKFENLAAVRNALEEKIEISKSEPQYRAKDPKIISDQTELDKIENFIAAIEEVEDVDEVFPGFDVADSLV